MAMLTKDSVFKMTPSGGTEITLTTDEWGFKDISFPYSMGIRETTSIGDDAITRESNQIQDYNFSFSVDYVTGTAQFLDVEGKSATWEFAPAGTASGMPKHTGTVVIESCELSPSEGGWMFNVSCQSNGRVVKGTY